MVETKVKAGTAAGGIVGVVAWALVQYVPAFRNGIPQPLMDALPFILAWIGHTAAAYLAPHTHRPDLKPQQGALTYPAQATQGNTDVTGTVTVVTGVRTGGADG